MNSDTTAFIAPPHPLIGLAKLMRMSVAGDDLAQLGNQLVIRASAGEGIVDANAFIDHFNS